MDQLIHIYKFYDREMFDPSKYTPVAFYTTTSDKKPGQEALQSINTASEDCL